MTTVVIESNAALGQRNTLALPARAAHFARIDTIDALRGVTADARWRTMPRFILGGGSNLVLTGDFDGLMLAAAIPGRELAGEDTEARYVRAGAGENWHEFVMWTLAQGWPGLENLALIPGTVGAAPIQNIGAYGLEVAERFHALTAFDFASGELVEFAAGRCRFGYRDSIFKQEGWHRDGRYLIVSVTFRLPRQWQARTAYGEVAAALAATLAARHRAAPTATDVADTIIDIRQRKLPDPAQIPNAGSFFQNPLVEAGVAARLRAQHADLPQYPQPDGRVKLAAGWLIDRAGWKGRRLGPVGMYEKQALVLVNHGGATGADVRALAAAVQADVQRQFGVGLTPEPIYLPA